MSDEPLAAPGGTPGMARSRGLLERWFDWLMLAFTALFVVGGYLLVRGNPGGPAPIEPFLSPAAFLVYAGCLPAIYLVTRAAVVGRSSVGGWFAAVPEGYQAALAGSVLLGIGLLLLLFDRPTDLAVVERLVTPGTILSFSGATLVATGPLLAFGRRQRRGMRAGGWSRDGAGLVAATTLVLALPSLLLSFAHPFVTRAGEAPGRGPGADTHTELYALPVIGGRSRRLTVTPDQDEVHPVVSPDGTRIAVGRGSLEDLDGWLLRSDGTDIGAFTDTPGFIDDGFTWSPDGSRLAWWSDLPVEPQASEHGAPTATPAPGPGGPPGQSGHDVGVWIAAADGTDAQRIRLPEGDQAVESWSPDGSHLCGWSKRSGDLEVWTFALDDSGARQVTDSPGEDWSCSWSPRGDRLAFQSLRDGDFEIFTAAPDGTDLRQLTHNDDLDMLPTWSPDGSRIAFISSVGGEIDVFVMSADGSDVQDVSQDPGLDDGAFGLTWTPDGGTIVAASRGRPYAPWPESTPDFGVVAIALLAALVVGVLGLALGFGPPIGFAASALVITALLLALVGGDPGAALVALVAGLGGDAAAVWYRRRGGAPARAAFGFAVPATLVAGEYALISATGSVGWSAPLVAGSILLAGFVGAAVALMVTGSDRRTEAPAP